MTEPVKKRISIVTGTRAEYGLLYPLMMRMKSDDCFDLRIIVTGMHLSSEFGLTYREIEEDGFIIDEKVEMLLSSDTATGISKSIGIGIISFADVFQRMRPDIVIVLGDRFESFAAALSAFIAKIPIVHLHGGELTEGVIDDSFRHSITKMSYLHFTSAEDFRRRVIQLGESPERVFCVGALGVDNIEKMKLLSKDEIEHELGFTFGKKTALVTFHPVTLENVTSENQFFELLNALDVYRDLKIIFTMPNADTDGRAIIRLIEKYVKSNPEKAMSFSSLGRMRYLSAMKYVDVVIGNSSSGIIETPSFNKPCVNIGDRQRGRIKAENIIDCRPLKDEIEDALRRALSSDFQRCCNNIQNPYGTGNTSVRILNILKDQLSKRIVLKKGFFDIRGFLSDENSSKEFQDTGDTDAKEEYLHF